MLVPLYHIIQDHYCISASIRVSATVRAIQIKYSRPFINIESLAAIMVEERKQKEEAEAGAAEPNLVDLTVGVAQKQDEMVNDKDLLQVIADHHAKAAESHATTEKEAPDNDNNGKTMEQASDVTTNRETEDVATKDNNSAVSQDAVKEGPTSEKKASPLVTERGAKGSMEGTEIPGPLQLSPGPTIRPSQSLGPGAHAFGNEDDDTNNNGIVGPTTPEFVPATTVSSVILNNNILTGPPSHDGLIEAEPVDDVVHATAKPMEWWTPKKITYLVLAVGAVLVAIAAGTTTAVLRNQNKNNQEEEAAPTLPPEDRWNAIQKVLIQEAYIPLLFGSNQTVDDDTVTYLFQNTSTPQYQALKWLAQDDAYRIHVLDDAETSHIVQRYALAVLYFATGFVNAGGEDVLVGINHTWVESFEFLQEDHECSWSGALQCGSDGDVVTGITLQGNGLVNALPSELAFLTSLEYLDLGGNQLVGPLPPALSQLTHLDLNRNVFTGTIHSSYATMTDLKVLHLQLNSLRGTLMENFGDLRKLTSLDFEANLLTGTIPESMWELTNMEVFILDTQKKLEGTISPNIGKWKNATMLLINVLNGLTGSIPTEIGLLTGLIELKTAQNHMRGTVSSCLW